MSGQRDFPVDEFAFDGVIYALLQRFNITYKYDSALRRLTLQRRHEKGETMMVTGVDIQLALMPIGRADNDRALADAIVHMVRV